MCARINNNLGGFSCIAVLVALCASLLLTGCNGVSGYTQESAGGTGAGSSSGSTGSGSSGASSSGASAPGYSLGGTVSGLTAGSDGFTIQDGLGDTLTVVSSGPNNLFAFPKVPPGETYNVTVQAQPNTPVQVCRVAHGAGVMTDANVTNVTINCVTPGKYLFAVNPADTPAGTGSVAAFTIDPHTGELTAVPGSPYATTQSHPSDIAIDPSGQYLYAPNAGSGTVSTDLIGTGGALTLDVSIATTGAAPGTPGANSPLSVEVGPDGAHLYVGSSVSGASGAIEAYALDGGVLTPAAGTLASSTYPAGRIPQSLTAAPTLDPANKLLFAANVVDNTIQEWIVGTDGSLTASLGSTLAFQNGAGANSPYAVAVHPGRNYLYVTDSQSDTVSVYAYYAFGTQLTPIATYSSGAPVQPGPAPLAIDPTGSFLYMACNGYVTAFAIDPAGGLLSLIGVHQTTGTASLIPTSVRVDPSSQFLYVANGDAGTISVFSINFATGGLTPVGQPVSARISNGGPSAMAIE